MEARLRTLSIVVMMLLVSLAAQAVVTLKATAPGDAQYAWNSKYGPYGYVTGTDSIGVNLQNNTPYGIDYTVSIFMIPLADLDGYDVSSALLEVESLGFGTGYNYGSAKIGWLNTGSTVLTGDVEADALGPASSGMPGNFVIYDSDYGDTPGVKSFDATSLVQQDIAAGHAYSTFVMSSSRDTVGSIYTAESGKGPRIIATPVPEPVSIVLIGAGLASLLLRRRRRA
ncbi:MAG: PEP-CTERM sorting domain-containing protein [Armatimonadota bacterium]